MNQSGEEIDNLPPLQNQQLRWEKHYIIPIVDNDIWLNAPIQFAPTISLKLT